ncbi:sperm axonemal maintenance protein CFAP97D1 [Embiotoca jacksoni]|uniref:sperm axonemal maintenance protein CFAP97D1 n=1 Tax=Embiotoca jacksoni TaxID=100190 RepID=UPI0037041841
MHRSYQPFKPVTNRFLQQRWDQSDYENHRSKVSSALPAVDTRGIRTPAHIQLKLKKFQLQDERLSVVDRDNRLLASKLADIVCSKGLVDHRNQYQLKSLNANKRRQELLLVSHQNQAIYQRITSRQSEYRRRLWLDDWERTERRLDGISRYPKAPADKQRSHRKVEFAAVERSEPSTSSSNSNTESTDRET